jgi:hypothetical protein
MLRLASALMAFLAISSSQNAVTAQASGCITYAPSAEQLRYVRLVRLPANLTGDVHVDVRASGAANFGDFLSAGGSVVVIDEAERNLGVINRDTLQSDATESDAPIISISRHALSSVDVGSLSAGAISYGGALATLPRTNSPGTPILAPGAVADVDRLKPRSGNPDGMQVGGFDGVPAPQVIVGPINGQAAPTIPLAAAAVAAQLPQAIALNATVAIYFRDKNNQKPDACNGFQIAPGLILTNLHCALARHERHVVHFGRLNVQPNDDYLPGMTVAGSVRCPATVVSPDPGTSRRLDFALLRISGTVPAPYNGAIVQLDDGSAFSQWAEGPSSSARLDATQVQYWLSGLASTIRQYEKYEMKPKNCGFVPGRFHPAPSHYCNDRNLSPTDPIDPSGIEHICDSERGSSGSPIFDPAYQRVLALHRGGGRHQTTRNCAVPAGHVLSQLKAWGYLNS